MRHFPLRELGYAIGFIALLAVLYVAAYCGTVVRNVISFHEGDADLPDTLLTTPNYRFGGEWACDFFSPMHALDKRMRPEYWTMHGCFVT